MLLQLLIIVTSCMFCVNARLCQDVSVRNEISSFEKHLRGCKVITGNLEITLIEDENTDDFLSLSFPELTEIRGFFLIYRVYGLTTLSNLFPNLAIIRGLNLLQGYSFMLFDVMDMKEIGLHSLKYILKGLTRIELCPHLCYVNTLNWTLIGGPSHKLDYFNVNEDDCGLCPEKCKGLCWNKHHCQQTAPDNCHPECVGCTGPNSLDKCKACRFYSHNGKCVSQCPKEKVRHAMLVSCMTHEECYNNPLRRKWWTFQGECIKQCPPQYMRVQKHQHLHCDFCGDSCRKICGGIEIDTLTLSDNLHGCTHIIGSLSIRIESKMKANDLYRNLDRIEEIDGYLKIHRSAPLTSLRFLKKLRVIHGNQLHKNKYALIAFENQNLQKLWGPNHTVEVKGGTMFFHDNPKLCLSELEKFAKNTKLDYTEFDVSLHSNGDKRTCNYTELNITIVNINSTNVTFVWEDVTATRNLSTPVGYLLSYTEDPFGNSTIDDEYDECYENIWKSIFVVDNQQHQIINLNPFTQYAYHIRLYTNLLDEDGQTKIKHFRTLSANPTELRHFNAISTASDSVTLKWEHPLFSNGILGRYELLVHLQSDDAVFVAQRDFCKHPHYSYHDVTTVTDTASDPCCKKHHHLIPSEEFEFTCDTLNIMMNADSNPGACNNYMYDHKNNDGFVPAILVTAHKIVKRSSFPTNSSNTKTITIEDPNITTFTIKRLKHFSMFGFLLKVCLKGRKTKCSSPVMAFQRTLPKDHADDISSGVSVHVKNSIVVIGWFEPREPNSMIVSYQVEYKKSDQDSSYTSRECITREDFIKHNHEFHIKTLAPGQYMVRVKAISLAGPGRFSEYINFEMTAPPPGTSSSLPYIIVVFLLAFMILIGVSYCYRCYYKNRPNEEEEILMSTFGSNRTGRDEWELDAEDITIEEYLTSGGFTTVYIGRIVSQNRECAVKTTSHTNQRDIINFFNETTFMKRCSGAYHVMRLFGVCSRLDRPMVLMEHVYRGNLKQYLLQLPSFPTTNEMYKMAIEIADGMFYLSSNGHVHQDLAARNCLVTADYSVKIGDYGISKYLFSGDYCVTTSGNSVPARWMAPESLMHDEFTTESDVWSYGVLLYEIATAGKLPYNNRSSYRDVYDFITNGGNPGFPEPCPELYYHIMENCWMRRPKKRVNFQDIVESFYDRVGTVFRAVSFYDSSTGLLYRSRDRSRTSSPSPPRTPESLFSRWKPWGHSV